VDGHHRKVEGTTQFSVPLQFQIASGATGGREREIAKGRTGWGKERV